ncbi:MAG: aldehyde dehydrogenase [Deltaproteobacteria bacterium]|nr:aldehyde dehydrogenase [Deltaproteobacteria bacterium]
MPDAAPLPARLDALRELSRRLAARRDDLVAAAGEDTGAPCRIAGIEVDLAVEHLAGMEEEAPLVAGTSPYGAVAAIFPYDAVPVMLARVGGAALLGGNRFRFNCSSQTPRTAAVVREIVAPFPELETPPAGTDNRTFGRACVRDPAVRVFFISGGGEVGAVYAREAAHFDKIFFAGPSGLPPVIFCRDAPLEAAVPFLVRRAFLNGGQYCTCPKRVYLHRDLYDEARDRILAMMPEIRVGDPADPTTWIGPIRVERTRKLLKQALELLKDARFLLPPRRDGVWQGPFLVETADPPEMELFGPFLALVRVADDEEAVARVLAGRYPFAVVTFGALPAGARERLAAAFGMTYHDPDFLFTPLRLPFGGRKRSGWILEWRQGKLRRRDGAFSYTAELVRSEK